MLSKKPLKFLLSETLQNLSKAFAIYALAFQKKGLQNI